MSYTTWKSSFARSFVSLCTLGMACTVSCSKESTPTKPSLPAQQQILRIATESDPSTLDPRKARGIIDTNLVRYINDGLMRIGPDGQPELALAQSVELSKDRKTYTFIIKDALWSNGDKVVAKDFEIAWKSQLNKDFTAPNSHTLFILDRAKAAYEGKESVSNVGVFAVDEKTLLVVLEKPIPYFYEMLTNPVFFPVNHTWIEAHPDYKEGSSTISCGPFIIDSWKMQNEITLSKNQKYWNADTVKLETVHLVQLDNNTALQMFEKGELDWVGSPLGSIPVDALQPMKEKGMLQTAPADGVQFVRVNCSKPLLDNKKVRQALAYAIDRKGICNHAIPGNYTPATGLVPPQMKLARSSFFEDNAPTVAAALLGESIRESKKEESAITLTLSYASSERTQKIAQVLQQNWQKALGITLQLSPMESKAFFSKVAQGDYELALGSWFADINDPIDFLSLFERKDNGTNNTFWENQQYKDLLASARDEINPEIRNSFLTHAQELIMNELPILPIFYFTFNYMKNPKVTDVFIAPTGSLVIENGYIIE